MNSFSFFSFFFFLHINIPYPKISKPGIFIPRIFSNVMIRIYKWELTQSLEILNQTNCFGKALFTCSFLLFRLNKLLKLLHGCREGEVMSRVGVDIDRDENVFSTTNNLMGKKKRIKIIFLTIKTCK